MAIEHKELNYRVDDSESPIICVRVYSLDKEIEKLTASGKMQPIRRSLDRLVMHLIKQMVSERRVEACLSELEKVVRDTGRDEARPEVYLLRLSPEAGIHRYLPFIINPDTKQLKTSLARERTAFSRRDIGCINLLVNSPEEETMVKVWLDYAVKNPHLKKYGISYDAAKVYVASHLTVMNKPCFLE